MDTGDTGSPGDTGNRGDPGDPRNTGHSRNRARCPPVRLEELGGDSDTVLLLGTAGGTAPLQRQRHLLSTAAQLLRPEDTQVTPPGHPCHPTVTNAIPVPIPAAQNSWSHSCSVLGTCGPPLGVTPGSPHCHQCHPPVHPSPTEFPVPQPLCPGDTRVTRVTSATPCPSQPHSSSLLGT